MKSSSGIFVLMAALALPVRAEFLQFAEVVERDGYVAVAGFVKLEVRGRDTVVGGEHFVHDAGRDGGRGDRHADQREIQNLAGENRLKSDAAIDLLDAENAIACLGDGVALGGQERVNLFERGTG